MTNQFIYISPKRFQAIVSVDSDIDRLEIYDLNSSSSTKEDLEEFVYRNPSLLNPGVHTTIITDIYPSVLLPYSLDSDIEQMLLKEAWDNDSESERIMKWITGETVFSNCRIATRLDEDLYHFIERTFHPVVIIDTLQIFLNKWKGECQKYKTGELSIHLDFDSEHFYIGVIKDNDSLISAPVYNFKPDYSYSLFFWMKLLRRTISREWIVRYSFQMPLEIIIISLKFYMPKVLKQSLLNEIIGNPSKNISQDEEIYFVRYL